MTAWTEQQIREFTLTVMVWCATQVVVCLPNCGVYSRVGADMICTDWDGTYEHTHGRELNRMDEE